jgi:hypothetical protein
MLDDASVKEQMLNLFFTFDIIEMLPLERNTLGQGRQLIVQLDPGHSSTPRSISGSSHKY